MKLVVLGSGAGGGVPQWNCHCENCRSARTGDGRVRPRTQSSLAVSSDGRDWILLNASPDLRQQVNRLQSLHEVDTPRGTRITSVILTDAEIDHAAGLLLMREADELNVRATEAVRAHLTDHFTLLPTLASFCELELQNLPITDSSRTHRFRTVDLSFEVFSVRGSPPSYSRRKPSPGDVTGLEITPADAESGVVYLPALGELSPRLKQRISNHELALIDGTFWTADEMSTVNQGRRTSHDMGHLPISGRGGSLSQLKDLKEVRKVYTHINNTNPILRPDSEPRRQVEDAGFEVAHDGMRFEL